MLESGAYQGGAVNIDFLTRIVDPHRLAFQRESQIAVCAHFRKRMEAQFENT